MYKKMLAHNGLYTLLTDMYTNTEEHTPLTLFHTESATRLNNHSFCPLIYMTRKIRVNLKYDYSFKSDEPAYHMLKPL
jgi:hypothetical protein